ncbi:hypothetical protein C1H69_02955 [Billgrantia endophytica]|uniref:Uncharacterized protein n=1 Tax=Billgrantia endophytica TaxID=2033802 RepID=A0A2N7UAN8_9GAMM|nr:hypothetical protein C1H69_02955 [Halomonas endophytica]
MNSPLPTGGVLLKAWKGKREILRIPPCAGKHYAHRMGAPRHIARGLTQSEQMIGSMTRHGMHDAGQSWRIGDRQGIDDE